VYVGSCRTRISGMALRDVDEADLTVPMKNEMHFKVTYLHITHNIALN